MKLGVLLQVEFKQALATLLKVNLPATTAYKLKGIVNKVNDESKKFEDLRQDALKRYGKLKEDGTLEADEKGHAILIEGGMENFVKELEELAQIDVEFPSIKISELGPKAELSVSTLLSLEDIIKE